MTPARLPEKRLAEAQKQISIAADAVEHADHVDDLLYAEALVEWVKEDITGTDGGDRPMTDGDPRHLDPAGDLAGLFESGEIDATVPDPDEREDLREWLDRAEAGEFGADPGVEATVRIVRSLLGEGS